MKKTIIIFVFVLTVLMGCKKLSVPTEVAGGATSTPVPAGQMTQTAIALETAGLSAQQTATAAAQQTASAVNTPNATQTAAAEIPRKTEVASLASVPGGTFTQSDGTNSFSHTISAFKMGKYEVTYQLWYAVRLWAVVNGYTFVNSGMEGYYGSTGLAPSATKFQPVTTINWRDCIVWCNAYSQMTGLTPVYCSDAGFTTAIKDSTNAALCDSPYVNWSANGFRLPTEGEWQYAASYKDGSSWTPWNYASGATADINDVAATGFVAWFYLNSGYLTGHDVGGKNANALGIYDMSGNVWEWCFDWYDVYPGTSTNYKGPISGSDRVIRGGSCYNDADYLRAGYRYYDHPFNAYYNYGFRFVRTY